MQISYDLPRKEEDTVWLKNISIGMPSKELARILMVSALRFFTGVMTFVMGITTMIKVSRTMWTKVTDAKIASSAPTELRTRNLQLLSYPHRHPSPLL
ncbi:hypothetical protein V6N13_111594 [Hibiscus sabdariffa]